ncbi:MAG: RnfABCDGE type electron transport complex subunit D [Clostridia bacterium]|nr:RnfABCDGE type electron transport complex subunit D [Clostridia bacterium]
MAKLQLSVSPHIHSGRSTRRIMLDVILALLPTTVAGVWLFGWRALALVAVCVLSCVLFEALFCVVMKKTQTVEDLSAIVTGLLLGLNLSVNLPIWQAVVGSAFAIIVVKCLFGGLGCNFVNPAITARVFMLIAFGSMVKQAFPVGVDAVSGATPLTEIASGNVPSLSDLFLGRIGGAIGEVCSLAILLGGVYLIVRRVITWHIPVAMIGSTFLFTFLWNGMDVMVAIASILSGGLLLGAIFMATDYVTSPTTGWGKIIFGAGAGLITVLIRLFGNYPEGVSFAILLMNILTPYIDSWTSHKLFGGAKA